MYCTTRLLTATSWLWDALQVFQVHYQQFGVVSDGSADITSQGQTASRLHRLGLPPVLPGGH